MLKREAFNVNRMDGKRNQSVYWLGMVVKGKGMSCGIAEAVRYNTPK